MCSCPRILQTVSLRMTITSPLPSVRACFGEAYLLSSEKHNTHFADKEHVTKQHCAAQIWGLIVSTGSQQETGIRQEMQRKPYVSLVTAAHGVQVTVTFTHDLLSLPFPVFMQLHVRRMQTNVINRVVWLGNNKLHCCIGVWNN